MTGLLGFVFFIMASFFLQGCQKSDDKLVLYTSIPERDMQLLLRDFKRENPDIEISFFRSGTNEIITKLKAEILSGNPKADLVMIADDAMMEDLKLGGNLASLNDMDVSALPKESYDADRTYFGIAVIGTGLVCHKDFTPKSTSLNYLNAPEMKNQVCMPSPVFSGTAAVNLSIISLQKEFGWRFWEKFINNAPLLVKGNGAVLDTVIKRGCNCGLLVDILALNAIEEGAALSFHYFKEGTPFVHHPVAVLKQSTRIDKATAFVKFIISKEGQESLSKLGYKPVRKDVSIPKTFQKITGFKPMKADAKAILARIEKDREDFSKRVH